MELISTGHEAMSVLGPRLKNFSWVRPFIRKGRIPGMGVVWYKKFTALGQPGNSKSTRLNNASVRTTYNYYADTGRLSTLSTQKFVGETPTGNPYQNLSYPQYDPKGNILTLYDVQIGTNHTYSYDNLDRLVSAAGSGNNSYSEGYTYDRIGNILTKTGVGTYTYEYGNKPHAVRNAGGMTMQYDANGNMTSRTGGTINLNPVIYNYDNKPVSINAGGNVITFTYDGNGQRVRKVSPGQTVLYFGDGYEKRTVDANTVKIIHLLAGNRRVASIRSDGEDQYYHTNHLGSSSVITDSYGNRKQQIEYYPFGTFRAEGSQQGTYDFDSNFPNANYTFTGQEDELADLGLYNYGARLYDPRLGRFIAPDRLVQEPGDPQTLNRYSYCLNNPLIYTDPSGEFIEWVIIGAIFGAFFEREKLKKAC